MSNLSIQKHWGPRDRSGNEVKCYLKREACLHVYSTLPKKKSGTVPYSSIRNKSDFLNKTSSLNKYFKVCAVTSVSYSAA